MKVSNKTRILLLLLALALILPLAVACKKDNAGDAAAQTTAGATDSTTSEIPSEATTEGGAGSTTEPITPPVLEPPVIEVDTATASVYSGTPDTTWYVEGQTEFTLTTADQLMGMMELRTETFTFEGITLKLGCDMVINQGTLEEIKARGSENYNWKDLHSKWSFKGVVDGNGNALLPT